VITGSSALFVKHLASMVLVGGFTFAGSWLLYRLTDLLTLLRVEEHHEQLGLDLSQHGETLDLIVSQIKKLTPTQLSGHRDALEEVEIFEHHPSPAND
jgi:hypothetical protein